MSKPRYFIRDDDIGELTDELRAFVEIFVARGVPVSYQIIPALLTEDCAKYLLAIEREYPHLVEFGQHGLRHGMQLNGKWVKREFGPERSLDQQTVNIMEGLALLKRRLGTSRAITVFTPPQHKYDRNTVVAAAAAGHRVFSAAYYATTHHQIAYAAGRYLSVSSFRHHGVSHHGNRRPEARINEVSIAVDVDDGRVIRYMAEAIPAATKRAIKVTNTVGFMFHHARYTGAFGRNALLGIADQLAALDAKDFHQLSVLGSWATTDAHVGHGPLLPDDE